MLLGDWIDRVIFILCCRFKFVHLFVHVIKHFSNIYYFYSKFFVNFLIKERGERNAANIAKNRNYSLKLRWSIMRWNISINLRVSSILELFIPILIFINLFFNEWIFFLLNGFFIDHKKISKSFWKRAISKIKWEYIVEYL